MRSYGRSKEYHVSEHRGELCGITLDNPVMAASGTFGYGYEFAELLRHKHVWEAFSFKGTTLEPRFGNPDTEDS